MQVANMTVYRLCGRRPRKTKRASRKHDSRKLNALVANITVYLLDGNKGCCVTCVRASPTGGNGWCHDGNKGCCVTCVRASPTGGNGWCHDCAVVSSTDLEFAGQLDVVLPVIVPIPLFVFNLSGEPQPERWVLHGLFQVLEPFLAPADLKKLAAPHPLRAHGDWLQEGREVGAHERLDLVKSRCRARPPPTCSVPTTSCMHIKVARVRAGGFLTVCGAHDAKSLFL